MAQSPPFPAGPLPALAAPASDPRCASIRALVEAHGDFVWRSLRRLGVPESAVDDATQQVFVVAARKAASILPGRERGFLFAILSHVAAHARRSLARKRELPYDETHERVDPALAPDEALAERQARAMLDDVLDEMDDDLRAVFVLFELEELTSREVAELTGLPVGTVASRLRRAREQFHGAARRVRARRGEP